MIDLKSFTPRRLREPEYSHILLLLFWPLYGLGFFVLEEYAPFWFRPVVCPLDYKIPFCEAFAIPYLFWFPYMITLLVYLGLFEPDVFRKLMGGIILAYTLSLTTFVVYPSRQPLRPLIFTRNNFCIRIVNWIYHHDTSTNTFPSVHVVGSLLTFYASLKARGLRRTGWRLYFGISCLLICASTLLIKQHSILDLLGGCVVATIVWILLDRTQLFSRSPFAHEKKISPKG